MELKVDIDETELQEIVTELIAKRFATSYSDERYLQKKIIGEAIKEVVYNNKEKIIDACVERAAVELTRKALPKLLDKLG